MRCHPILCILVSLSAGQFGTVVAARRAQCSTGASASSASPSRYQPSRTSPSASSVTPATCQPHSTTTKTSYTTVWETTGTSTIQVSGTVSTFLSASTTTITTVATTTLSLYTSTTTSTITETSTSYEIIPASTTITIPTASGFTPVSCLAAYLDPTVTSTTTLPTFTTIYSGIATYTYRPRDVVSYNYTSSTTITSVGLAYELESITSVYTSTIANPTSTVYAACATNNVVSDGPWGSRFGIPSSQPGTELTSKANDVFDATGCCAACQADPTCFVSTTITFSDGSFSCYFFAPPLGAPNSTCDPTFQAAEMRVVPNNGQDFLDITISNGACGQYLIR